ncbi:hypothetical protein [Azohydromonas aeria]|uniref:hypothetical protein n=1 Tax=Azohydromonas aeria TaxID=2590212 RepID=UPI0012F75062|nr:hypothetical protein [Azohydromonas aeria]
MTTATTVVDIGFYCGRFGPGFWGEPFNQLGNLAFIVGALIAFQAWRRQARRDPWQLPLFALAALIGIGSLVFHGHPTPLTLTADLVPIQLFGLALMAYVLRRHLKWSPGATVALLLGFFLVRQVWIRGVQPVGQVLHRGTSHEPDWKPE